MSTETINKTSPIGVSATLYAVAVWGFGNVLANVIPLPGPELSFIRMVMGVAMAYVLLVATKGRLTKDGMRKSLFGGLSFAINSAAFFTAVKYTSPNTATIIGTLQPFLLMLVSSRLFGERVEKKAVLAGLVAIIGTSIAIFGAPKSGHDTFFGDFLAFIALLSYAAYFIFSKQARKSVSTLEYQLGLQIWATIFLLPLALFSHTNSIPSISTLALVLLLAVVPGGGHFAFNWAHKHTTLVTASLLTLGAPIVTIIFSYIMLGQSVSISQVLGTAITIVALSFVVISRSSVAEE
ncbi:MAG: DMT family transporter [Actinomycetota bacterium]|nr:DMT family transporter [Actinomycetota bacterium]